VINLIRDCEGVRVPEGVSITLPKGMEVRITQSLGGSFTVIVQNQMMVRIEGKDADALGKKPEDAAGTTVAAEGKSLEERVWDALRTCFDPEIPHSIVDLGLVYECKLTDHPEGDKKVYIKMTLTAPGCGMGDFLKKDVENKVKALSEIRECHVEMVTDPPWDTSKINPELKPYIGL
jgi:probable FeS assembly SUF system protein SufT